MQVNTTSSEDKHQRLERYMSSPLSLSPSLHLTPSFSPSNSLLYSTPFTLFTLSLSAARDLGISNMFTIAPNEDLWKEETHQETDSR